MSKNLRPALAALSCVMVLSLLSAPVASSSDYLDAEAIAKAEAEAICYGTPGQWSGCRGNGCAVCAELVESYTLYFENHPACSPNHGCEGLYFTCNEACPAPTSADICYGTPGQWAGCRGNGCAVCAEKVTGYNLYWENHPSCSPNNGCGGLYFTCNSRCPAPTSADICYGTPGEWKGCRGHGCAVCSEKVAGYELYFHNHPTCDPNGGCGGLYYTCNERCPAPTNDDICYGTSGEWRGCRGTGCNVCAELVADYPCYFQNHPLCKSNVACGGLYFTCNENCPAPTEADRCK